MSAVENEGRAAGHDEGGHSQCVSGGAGPPSAPPSDFGGAELTCLTGRILKKFFQIIFRGETCTDRLSSFSVT